MHTRRQLDNRSDVAIQEMQLSSAFLKIVFCQLCPLYFNFIFFARSPLSPFWGYGGVWGI